MTPETRPTQLRNHAPARIGFGKFELDRVRGLLFRNGKPVPLQAQPMAILVALVDRAGQDVTREELQKLAWPEGTFIEFESGIATAIRKIRVALGDSAERPTYVRTLHGRGFRFIAPVHLVAPTPASGPGLEPRLEPDPPAAPVEPPAPTPAVGRRWLPWALAAALIAAAIAAAVWFERPRPAAQPVRFAIDLPAGQEFQFYAGRRIAISRDGKTVAYIASLDGILRIFVRSMGGAEIHPLPNTDNARVLCFSPDGADIAFLADGELKRISLDGRRLTRIARLSPSSDAGRFIWETDGNIYFNASHFRDNTNSVALNVFRVPAAGGDPVVLLSGLPPSNSWHYPQQLMDGGRSLLFSSDWAPSDMAVNLWNFADKRYRQVIEHASGGEYFSSGHIVFARSGNLMAAPFDPGSMRLAGAAVMVEPNIAADRYSGLQAAVSETGTLVFMKGTIVKPQQPVWVDMQGHESPANLPAARYRLLDLSPDGGKLLAARYDAGETWSIWLVNFATSEWRELLSGDNPGVGAIFSPDGQSMAVSGVFRGEHYDNIYIRSLSGAGPDKRLAPEAEEGRFPQSWSRAANAVAYTQGYNQLTKQDIYVQSLDSASKPRCFVCTPDHDEYPSFSPDGRWIAYTVETAERSDVYARPYPGPGAAVRVSPDGGSNSLWAPDGREIYYRRGPGMWAVPFDPSRPGARQARLLFSGPYSMTPTAWNRDMLIAPDGKRFLMLKVLPEPPDSHRIQVVLNWFEELKKLAPTGK